MASALNTCLQRDKRRDLQHARTAERRTDDDHPRYVRPGTAYPDDGYDDARYAGHAEFVDGPGST